MHKVFIDAKQERLFFFSQQQKDLKHQLSSESLFKQNSLNDFKEPHQNMLITADGLVYEYTEACPINSKCLFSDAEFIAADDKSAIIHNGKPLGKLARERLDIRKKLINSGKLKPIISEHWSI